MAGAIILPLRSGGIYLITNLVNGKRYVGSSVNVRLRLYKHQAFLRRGDHPNAHLQAAWNKYGEAAFAAQLLEECPDAGTLLEAEQRHIDRLQPEYNICQVAGNTLGFRHSEADKRLMSEQRVGNKFALGHKHRPESIAKMSAAAKRRPPKSEEERQRISERMRGNAHTLGIKFGADTKAKVGEASRRNWSDPEIRARHIAGRQTYWSSEEAKRAHAERMKAHWADEEKSARHRERILSHAKKRRALTDEDAARMRLRRADGLTLDALALEFGVSRPTCQRICASKSYI